MAGYFTRERFGRPQFYAGLLLAAFLAQALWLMRAELGRSSGPDALEAIRISEGWKQWHGEGTAGAPFAAETPNIGFKGEAAPVLQTSVAPSSDESGFDREHSPLLYLVSAAPLLGWPQRLIRAASSNYWQWLPRLPFLACGVFLGASLWYVARRLCGNMGGLVALTLYCFSPGMIQAACLWHVEPEIVSAWGTFGTIFTAIAVAHTLYAPREVVLWNWRRIVLLGTSLAITIGSEFAMVVVVPIALAFLLYVAPVRKQAAIVIWVAACAVGLFLLLAIYFFSGHGFIAGMRHAIFWGATWRGFTLPALYKEVARRFARECPALVFGLPVALATYAVWPRTRYFGNTAPLMMAVVFAALGIAHPHLGGAGFLLSATPFLFIFVAGVLADLMETRHRALVTASVFGMLLAYALWNLVALAHVPRG